MTLYRNLGPICYQSQTQNFQIFSAQQQTIIIQFKNYHSINIQQIQNILSVYTLILKQQDLLQIYQQKNKPSSILLHKSNRIQFQKIDILLLCKIIKQMCISIIHSQRIVPKKIGEINKEMFFQINGELRYLYFPIVLGNRNSQVQCTKQKQNINSNHKNNNFNFINNYNNNNQTILLKLVDFFHSLKDQKQLSHRLLLKKIAKCSTIQQILDQTQYFMNIYYAKQNNKSTVSNLISAHQQSHLKQLNKSKNFGKIFHQSTNLISQLYNKTNEKKNILGLQSSVSMSNQSKTNRSRKYNLFKNLNLNFNNMSAKASNSFAYTWRTLYKQNNNQSRQATLRMNTRILNNDGINRICNKSASNSLVGYNTSLAQSRKLGNSRKKTTGFSLHQTQKNKSIVGQNLTKNKPCNQSIFKKSNMKINSSCINEKQLQMDSFIMNDSIISQKFYGNQINVNESLQQNQQSSKFRTKNWIKQMVNNSLQKSKLKQETKNKIFNERSTQIDNSRSKFTQKFQNKSNDIKNLQISQAINKGRQSFTQSNLNIKSQLFTGANSANNDLQSDKKLKKKGQGLTSKYQVPQSQKQQKNQKKLPEETKKQQKSNKFPHENIPSETQSLQEINLTNNPRSKNIQKKNICEKNNHIIQKIDPTNKLQRKKTSMKDFQLNDESIKKICDQSQTQRIKYSNISKKNLKSSQIIIQKSQSQRQRQEALQKQINQLMNKLSLLNKQKQQIDYIGIAVVQTHDHLKVFETIFWQLPMFFLYKKFYQRRIKLSNAILNILQTQIQSDQSELFKQFQSSSNKLKEQVKEQNQNIEQSLKKLLKTAKKKLKKSYPNQTQQNYIQKYLHLDYTIPYDNLLDEFILMYLNSLNQAKPQFPQLTVHINQVYEALIIYKGGIIDQEQKNKIFQNDKLKQFKLQCYQAYFQFLSKKKEIKTFIHPESQKPKKKVSKSKTKY